MVEQVISISYTHAHWTLFMWPSARISVVGGEQAVGGLRAVKQEQLCQDGQPLTGFFAYKLTVKTRQPALATQEASREHQC